MRRVSHTHLLACLQLTPCMSVRLCCMSVYLCCMSVCLSVWCMQPAAHSGRTLTMNSMGAGYWAAWQLCLCAGMLSQCSMPSGAPSHGSWGILTPVNPPMIFFTVSIHCWQPLAFACLFFSPCDLFFEQRLDGGQMMCSPCAGLVHTSVSCLSECMGLCVYTASNANTQPHMQNVCCTLRSMRHVAQAKTANSPCTMLF